MKFGGLKNGSFPVVPGSDDMTKAQQKTKILRASVVLAGVPRSFDRELFV